ncbi:unnamed protein product [Kuraishia capsulata CBS 1993]|uniref:Uncharacterized protein n=1 Tax=Kuraishia capsulata CBS 1993 TaxID=1382522 RepID=W6MMD7_9ASCO|nr:uncharacterized protein KUCA_T00003685001 [Kuraishia capsulata CBS 1993]CDK27706.1 unnamed protein product [Kuraishia capsulata CBS 1993]
MFNRVIFASTKRSFAGRVLPQQVGAATRGFSRSIQQAQENQGIPPRLAQLMSQIGNHPNLLESFQKLRSIAEQKQLIPTDSKGSLSLMQQFKFLTDNDIKACLSEIKQELESSNIQFAPQDAKLLFELLTKA